MDSAYRLTGPCAVPQACMRPGQRLREVVQALGRPGVVCWALGCAWHPPLRDEVAPDRLLAFWASGLGEDLDFHCERGTPWQGS